MQLFGGAQQILGLNKRECSREEIIALIHEDDIKRFDAASQLLVTTGLFDLEYRIHKQDGSIAWIHGVGIKVGHDKDNTHIFGTVQDITSQKDIEHELERRVADRTIALEAAIRHREEAQKQLVRAQRMEAFGQLTGGIAHDFNNLLTIIGGNLELVQDQLMGETPRRQLRKAIDAVGMGARLTQRLLTFARRSDLEPEVLNLNEQVINMIDLLRRTIGETITISSMLAPDLGRVRADASEVENAILNLAINARDAMPTGGKLTIETVNAEIDDDFAGLSSDDKIAPGHYVRLSVSDTGVGMTPEVLARAFEPFFTTKEHGRGTGLGLASIYGFARQSGGHATIYSEVSLGTTVTLYLPRTDQSVSKNIDPLVAFPETISRRILVVEDNPDICELTIQRLAKLGYSYCASDSGPAAIEMLKADPAFDLVFSDIMMAGGMSGYDLAEWIQAALPSVRVLLTSGFSDEQTKPVDRAGRNLKVLRKPYASADLAAALQEAFEAT